MKIYKITKIDKNDVSSSNIVIATSKRSIPEELKKDAVFIRDITPANSQLMKKLNNTELTEIEKDYIFKALEHSKTKRRS